MNWQISDKVYLNTDRLGARLSAQVAPDWTFSIFGRYELREYRLDSDSSVPDGVMRDTRVPIGVGVAWEPCKRFRLGLDGGVIVYQEFIFDDKNGNRVAKDRADPTGFVGISAQIRF